MYLYIRMHLSLLLSAIPNELPNINKAELLEWQVRYTGVGAITAAVNTTIFLQELKPKKVVFIGTCGSYSNKLGIGDFLTVSKVINTSLDIVNGNSYKPKIESSCWPATLDISLPSIIKNELIVASTPGITKTACGANELALFAAAENLELAGVFEACHKNNIPCGAILVVTNQVGPDAHSQWKFFNKTASKKLLETLYNIGYFK